MNLNQVTLPVHDIAQCKVFYQKFGCQLIVDTAHYVRFQCPGGETSFSLVLEKQAFQNGSVIYFESENLDLQVSQLQKKGLVFEQLPVDQPYLWREATLFDPSNNKIKLYWAGVNRLNPPWRIASNDE